jgi:drug/metabolite transporter (DMT)-like permease
VRQTGAPAIRTISLTILALIAFAANSVLCRKALGANTIDAASFTMIRLVSGALMLSLILVFHSKGIRLSTRGGSWSAAVMLFLYAIAFSFSYNTLQTGTGALILFGSVQITMIVVSLVQGTRLHISEWLGVVVAFAGFVYLILPGISTPSFNGFLLMTISGIAWGLYTLKGRGSENALKDTGWNFLRTLPLVVLLAFFSLHNLHISFSGVMLAVLSGGIASGIGYSIWYSALGDLSATQAAVVQLSVPLIAAIGGVVFVSEALTMRLAVSTALILGGILLVVLGRHFIAQAKTTTGTKRQE